MDSNENKNNNQNTRKKDKKDSIDEFDNISINYSYKGSRTEQSLKNLSHFYSDCNALFKSKSSNISSFKSSHILPRKCNSLNKNLIFNVNLDFNSIKSISSFEFHFEIQKGNLIIRKSKCKYK